MSPDQLAWFIAAGLLLNLTPGPDVLYIVSQSLRSGARAGIVAGLGITAGCFVHIAAAALGLSALMATSATAFTVLKWVGAAYLMWLGLSLLLARRSSLSLLAPDLIAAKVQYVRARGLKSIFFRGFLTNVLNPKVALFFLAFVPQFIAPSVENKALAFVLLGVLFNFNAFFVNTGWAFVTAWLARRADPVQRSLFWLDKVAGLLFVGFGLKLALSDNPAQ